MQTIPKILGRQVLAEMHECDEAILDDPAQIQDILTKAVRTAGAKVLGTKFHQFMPQGVSGMVLISESHLAIHTWPEYRFASVDLFTCGTKFDSNLCLSLIKQNLKASQSDLKEIPRGVLKRENSNISCRSH